MVSDFKKSARPCSTSLETLTRDATNAQRDEIERALSENAAGVEQLALRVLNDPEINNPIACFLSKLRNGAHRERKARTDGMNERTKITIPWDPALAEQNAEHARALIQRLTSPGCSHHFTPPPENQPEPPPLDDDDIPGYGDAA